MPRDTCVGKRPKQLRPISGAAIEQAVGRIADEAVQIYQSKRKLAREGRAENGRANECAERDENQRVRELPVIFQIQQRVIVRTDKRVKIRRHSGENAAQYGHENMCFFCRG